MRVKKGYYERQFKIARQAWATFSPKRRACLQAAKEKQDGIDKWKCTKCEQYFAYSEIQCDHVVPIANTNPQTLEEYLQLFKKLDSDNLQILCKRDHLLKTRKEKSDRNKAKYVENILQSFTIPEKKLLERDLSELKSISHTVNIFREGRSTPHCSKKLHKFVESFD